VGDGEPAERADEITSGGGVDDAALENPIRSVATGLNGSGEIRGGGGWIGAGDNNDEHTERVGVTEQVEGGKGAAQPRQRSSSRVGEIGSGAGEVKAVKGGRMNLVELVEGKREAGDGRQGERTDCWCMERQRAMWACRRDRSWAQSWAVLEMKVGTGAGRSRRTRERAAAVGTMTIGRTQDRGFR
jgi:hypothetical protein